jgi:hypothetical protein
MAKRKLIAEIAAETLPAKDAEQVTIKHDGDTKEARSVSRSIRTVEDLLRHIEADMTLFEVAASEATKWEATTGRKSQSYSECSCD